MRIVVSKIVLAAVIGLATGLATGCVTPGPEESVVGDYLSGRLAARTNDVNAAASAFSDAQNELVDSQNILRDAFFFQLAAGDFSKAIPFAQEIVRLQEIERANPREVSDASEDEDQNAVAVNTSADDGLAKVVLAAHEIKLGRYQSARDILASGIEADYFAATVKIMDAWAVSELEGLGVSMQMLLESVEGEFRGFNPLHLALLAQKAGNSQDAQAAHQLSVMSYGGGIGRVAFGAFLERSGDEGAAREYYDLLAQDAGPERKLAQQAFARLDAGKASDAYADVDPATGASIALYTLAGAIVQQTTNQRVAAERAGFNVGEVNYNMPLLLTRLSLYLDPNLGDARRFAASILNIYGDHDAAIEMLKAVPSSSPYYQQSLIEIARAMESQGKTAQAISILRKAARRDEQALEMRLFLSSLEASHGNHAAAVRTLDALIKGLPADATDDSWRYYVARAVSLLELDDWPRAESDLQRAVEIAPEEAAALNYLGYSWVERGLNLDEAFGLIEKAVSIQPDSGAIIDSLGWAHYQRGDYAEAVGHIEQAASLEAGDATVTDHLGDVYWRLDRKIEAGYQWQRVLELEPSDALRDAVTVKLERGLPDEKL